jgi:N-acetyl-gamma-glutamyl-phosphate reductase
VAGWKGKASVQSVRTAVVGASGYSGQELLRRLARHPVFKLALVTSRQAAGQKLAQTLAGLPREAGDLTFVDAGPEAALAEKADLFFLALPHGAAAPYVVALRKAGRRVVDLSADFRTADPAVYREFYGQEHPAPELLGEAVYGLPELHRERLATAGLIASPGCFPTSIILPLAPFLRAKLLRTDTISIVSMSGVSGAGRKVELRLLFGEVDENMYPYSVPTHRHLGEIEQELAQAAGEKVTIGFVPHLVPLQRGMLSTTTAALARPQTETQLRGVLTAAYAQEPFVEILPEGELPETRDVMHSNRIRIAVRLDARTNRLLLLSAIDNLGKGAATQAIQSANIAWGLPENAGLDG